MESSDEQHDTHTKKTKKPQIYRLFSRFHWLYLINHTSRVLSLGESRCVCAVNKKLFRLEKDGTDGWTDGRTDGRRMVPLHYAYCCIRI